MPDNLERAYDLLHGWGRWQQPKSVVGACSYEESQGLGEGDIPSALCDYLTVEIALRRWQDMPPRMPAILRHIFRYGERPGSFGVASRRSHRYQDRVALGVTEDLAKCLRYLADNCF